MKLSILPLTALVLMAVPALAQTGAPPSPPQNYPPCSAKVHDECTQAVPTARKSITHSHLRYHAARAMHAKR